MPRKANKSYSTHRERVDAAAANRRSGAERRRVEFMQSHPHCSCAECVKKAEKVDG
jgi:hypothetical protein